MRVGPAFPQKCGHKRAGGAGLASAPRRRLSHLRNEAGAEEAEEAEAKHLGVGVKSINMRPWILQ
jgi:hypothetical protein